MILKYFTAGLFCFSLLFFQACSSFRYAAVDDTYMEELARASCNNYEPKRISEDPVLYTRCLLGQMNTNPDETVRLLGKALSRLPDVHHQPGFAAALGIQRLNEIAASATAEEKALLLSLALDNEGKYQYSGSLQGLLWMAEEEEFNRTTLKDVTLDSLLGYAWDELTKRLNSPQQILLYLSENYSYVLNRDSTQQLKTFFRSKYGDCSEFSLLAGYFLQKLGFDVFILIARIDISYWHSSTVFHNQEGYWLLDASMAAITRTLKHERAQEPLTIEDHMLWRKIKDFDRLHGPFPTLEAAVSPYKQRSRKEVLFKYIRYETYHSYIETYGQESASWWIF